MEPRARAGSNTIVGRSGSIEAIRVELRRLSTTRVPVCVCGEEGTGKELIARTLHELSNGADGSFVAVACGRLDEPGWDRYWTGDEGDAAGALQRARGGTLFLDGLTDLAPELQLRLLATLGLGEQGQPREPSIDRPRVVVSSRLRPQEALEAGGWTAEAARCLGSEALYIPPLRERREDVAPLARHFVTEICEINRLPEIGLSSEAVERLEAYHWPANVQELRNAMEQAVIVSQDGAIRSADLPERVREGRGGTVSRSVPLPTFREAKREVVERFERSYLRELMERHDGNVTAASQQAGMLRSALQRLLRKHEIRSAEFRGGRPGAERSRDVDR